MSSVKEFSFYFKFVYFYIAGWPVSHDLVILFRLMLAGDAIALGSNQVEVEVEVHFH